jgi:HSP20 family molecular chaperone IbpA
MSFEFFHDHTFDLLWKNMLDHSTTFRFLSEKINYPVDIYENESGIVLEIAAVGIESSDVDIEVDKDILRIKHEKSNTTSDENKHYLHKGLAKRNFDLSWKISSNLDLAKLNPVLDKGILSISIPVKTNLGKDKLSFKPKTKAS